MKRIIAVALAIIMICSLAACGVSVKNNGNDNDASTPSEENKPASSVILRTITLADKDTAEYVFAKMETANFNERKIIEIMDYYGEEQGGGQEYLIEPGEFVEEIDEWCFSKDRKVGDAAIIDNDFGYSICYISKILKD